MEMLIVVGIIGLLSTLGVYSFNTAQRNARDVQRMSDLGALQKGMESYYAETGTYTCSEQALIQSGALPDGFPVDPKTQIGVEFLTYLQKQLQAPFAGRSLVPQAYAQGSCSFCINNSAHQTQCTNQGGTAQFHLPCNSKVCCFVGSTPASPTPSPGSGGGGGTASPSPGTGGNTGGTGGTGGSTSDPAAVTSSVQKYTLSRCSTSSYCACTRLERSGTGNASDRNCTWAAGGSFYCVQQAL